MNYRLFLLHGDAKYFDVLERTLYNGYRVYHWTEVLSSTPTRCLLTENTAANLGSAAPAALQTSAVSFRHYRDMYMP